MCKRYYRSRWWLKIYDASYGNPIVRGALTAYRADRSRILEIEKLLKSGRSLTSLRRWRLERRLARLQRSVMSNVKLLLKLVPYGTGRR